MFAIRPIKVEVAPTSACSDMSDWVMLDPISDGGDIVIKGVTTDDAMIQAGAEALKRRIGNHPDAEKIVDEIYFAMRKATGEGAPLRRVKSKDDR